MSHTDSGRSTRSARDGVGDAKGALPKPRKGGPPPLTWLILGLLLVIGLIAFMSARGTREPVRPGPSMPTMPPSDPLLVEPATAPPPARTTGPSGGPAAPVTPTE